MRRMYAAVRCWATMKAADPQQHRLGIAVVHHRGLDVLETCLGRLTQATLAARVVVVDTSGSDEAEAVVARHPPVRRLVCANHSYAHATNVGWKALATPLLAVMNADAWVEPRTFVDLAAALSTHPDAGVAGPRVTDAAGRLQDLGLPYRLHYARLRRAARSRRGTTAAVRAPWLSGCLLVVRRDVVVAVGGLDASLRFFNEDLEFCSRARRAGFSCLLVDTPTLHLGGTSTPSHPAFHVEGRRGGWAVSRRYAPPALRALHRAFLLLESAVGGRFARDALVREAHRRMGSMLRTDDVDTSPFGATLDDR